MNFNLQNFLDIVKRNHLAVGIILAAGVVSVLWIFWFIGATRYQSVVTHWIETGRSQGYDISYDRREQFGFPHHTVLRFVNLHWKNTDGIEFHAGDLDISADLWQTKVFLAKFKGQVEIDVPVEGQGYSLILAGEGGEAKVTLADDGTWERSSIAMKSSRIGRAPDYLFLADDIKLSGTRPAKQPTTVKEPGLTLSGTAEHVTLPQAMPPSFGSKMPKLQVDLRVMGAVPDFRKKDSVAAWNKNYGVVQFDRLDLDWGDLLLTSKGAMGFDDDLQPEGAFAAVVAHQDRVFETLTKAGFIAASQQEMLTSAMRLFAKPASSNGVEGVEVPVAVQLGGFFLGPVKIFSFPQIGWE
jgi:hypothetical protein